MLSEVLFFLVPFLIFVSLIFITIFLVPVDNVIFPLPLVFILITGAISWFTGINLIAAILKYRDENQYN